MQVISNVVTFATTGTEAGPPDWIKVAPRGRFTARDGRTFEVVPELLIERFKSDAISIPVDINHSTIRKAATGDETPAYGWIEELEAREDGLYARVNWLDRGKTVLAEKSHRYISPAFGSLDAQDRATWLHSVALVATPAVAMPALASAETNHKEPLTVFESKIAAALGLDIDATTEEIASKVATLTAKADGTEAIITGLQGVMKTLSTEVITARNSRVEAKVEQAIKLGTVTPALKDFCVTIANSSETLFDEFCTKMGTPFAYLSKPAITREMEVAANGFVAEKPVTLNTEASRLAAQLGIDVKSLL
ncbi:phage protease [Rhizobium lemnae]|uniref:Phage protease n=1 Tax=Rhizobium lemnae TaxID=1214924 RepID=A0ABV8E5V1_9HYPH|nr:phage protease [Rhizobium lemnae]MCJ8506610.1 phage protease [Rhizobium lemnae]